MWWGHTGTSPQQAEGREGRQHQIMEAWSQGAGFRGRILVFRKTCSQSRCSLGGRLALGREATQGPSRSNKMGLGCKIQALASLPGAVQLH